MSEDTTARDRVWAAIIKLENSQFTVADIKDKIEAPGDNIQLAYGASASPPESVSEETIKRVLRAGTELGVIDHKSNSKYYEKKIMKTVEVEEYY